MPTKCTKGFDPLYCLECYDTINYQFVQSNS